MRLELLSTTRRQRLSLSSGSRNNEAAPVPALVVAIFVQIVDYVSSKGSTVHGDDDDAYVANE